MMLAAGPTAARMCLYIRCRCCGGFGSRSSANALLCWKDDRVLPIGSQLVSFTQAMFYLHQIPWLAIVDVPLPLKRVVYILKIFNPAQTLRVRPNSRYPLFIGQIVTNTSMHIRVCCVCC